MSQLLTAFFKSKFVKVYGYIISNLLIFGVAFPLYKTYGATYIRNLIINTKFNAVFGIVLLAIVRILVFLLIITSICYLFYSLYKILIIISK